MTRSVLSSGKFRISSFARAMAIGAVGGFIFFILDLPLPWMMGAMAACMLAAIIQVPIAAPSWVRPPMSAVIGAMLGAGFPTDILSRMLDWIYPLAGLVAFILASALFSVSYFRFVARFDSKTAYFCGMPGGLIEMTLLGEEVGADARRIALVHTARILMVVFIVPVVLRYWNHPVSVVSSVMRVSVTEVSPIFFVWLAATCVAGTLLGKLLRLPARYLMGSMLISGALHVSGVTNFVIPYELLAFAQVALGVTIGCRFAGVAAREVGKVLLLSIGSTAILLSLTTFFAWLLHQFTGIDVILLILAYSPGGLAEMGLVALSLNLDTALVATHHIFRVVLVGFGASTAFKLFDRFRTQATSDK